MAVYGLLGQSLSHSFSAAYFKEKFSREGIAAEYRNFELERIELLPHLLQSTTGLRGLNVTIPYKTAVLPLVDSLDPTAAQIGSVNTLVLGSHGQLKGYNTDHIGFSKSIAPYLQSYMDKALILGSGGASLAVHYSLAQMGLEVYTVSRQQRPGPSFMYSELSEKVIAHFKLIIHCTPLGTAPDLAAKPALPYGGIGPSHLLVDLVYNPPVTAFMKTGIERGATAINGLQMLHIQAEESWKLWNGSGA